MIISIPRKRFALAVAAMACLLWMLLPAVPALAAPDIFEKPCDGVTGSTLCDEPRTQTPGDNALYGPNGVLTKVANIIALVVGVAAVIVIIVAGIRYVVSSGDSNNINSAKNAILFAVVGLCVAILAKAVVIFVLSRI